MSNINVNKTKEILECFDLFGTKIGFYTEGKPKFYTAFGGLLSIISILISIVSFFLFSLEDLKRVSPITTSSSIPSEGYRRIKFNEEKIWIPIRISDYYHNFIKYGELIYLHVQYYYAERKNISEAFNIKIKNLSYKLCNETSMVNKPDIYSINVPLDQLYCIDTDDLEIGGFWDSTFLSYFKFDLYFCKNRENYNESNPNCTTYDDIRDNIGYNNSLEFEIYYPTVQFQPLNYNNPIIILYRYHFYHISRYSNKITRLFLQEYVLADDNGWFGSNFVNNSYFGLSSINWDDYATPETKDLINQGSTSRFYSLNIYLEPGIILYKRKYKKVLSIFADGLPIMYLVFLIFENIAKMFKSTEENKIMIELLFENLKEKPNKFLKHLNMIKENNNEEISYSKNNKTIMQLKKNGSKKNSINKISLDIPIKNINDISNKKEKQIPYTVNAVNHKIKQNDEGEGSSNIFVRRRNLFNSLNGNNTKINKNKVPVKSRYVVKKLFPNRFYFFSSFIKNSNIKKSSCFFDNKFTKVYTFLAQMIDISTYLLLKREFDILKVEFLDDKKRNYLEKNKKINVGAHTFIRDINQSLNSKNFDIFSKQNNFKK